MVKLEEVSKHFKADHLTRPLIKYFYYPVSVFYSWIAINLGVSAHIVNLSALLAAFASAAIIWYLDGLWFILAGVLVLFGLVVDLSDGTVARYYNKKNAMGKWLDESTGFISFAIVFFALMMKSYVSSGDLWLIVLGTYTIFSYMMINYASLLSEVLRKKFELDNPLDKVRERASKTLFGISPGAFAFSLDIQWTLIAIGVIFNAPYFLFITFSLISSVQWMARYVVFWGK